MKILVTGGSGFIGTRLVSELLKAGHQVTIFDKNNSSKFSDFTVIGDVRDKVALIKAAAGHDIIYHLAAESFVSPSLDHPTHYMDVNYNGTVNLIDAIKALGIKTRFFKIIPILTF